MNERIWTSGVAVAALVWSAPVLAQNGQDEDAQASDGQTVYTAATRSPIVVTASRGDRTPASAVTSAYTLLSQEDVADRQTRDIADILRDVPGVSVSSIAGQTQIRLRGSEANHVLVLVDGIEVSDPGSGEYDLGTLQTEIGSSVEVLRGPQSALYGNDAIAGVVAYSSGDFDGIAGRFEVGTNDTFNGAARIGVDNSDLSASLSATVVSTDGEPNARGGTRDIGRDSYTVSGKISGRVSDSFTLRAVGRFVQTEGQSNNQDFDFTSPTLGQVIDSPGVGFESEALFGLVGAKLETLGGAWVHDLSAQFADTSRNSFASFGTTSDTESDRFKVSYVSSYDFGTSGHSLTFAADYELEGFNNIATFNARRESENFGLVGEYRYVGSTFDFSAAIRQDFNNRFQDTTTFRVGAGLNATDTTRLRASIGSGVKNPTFTELFGFFDGVFLGNPDLQPEESTSWEIGVDQRFANDAAVVSVTYFNAELENEVFTIFGPAPTFTATPANRDTQSDRQGVEVALSANIGPQWSVNAAYAYVDSKENGVAEIRRPESIASGALTWTAPGDKASATLVVRHNGETPDTDFGTFSSVTLDDFTLVNFNARVKLVEGVSAFGRVENLLDETYEQVFSFVSPGRTALIGIEARF